MIYVFLADVSNSSVMIFWFLVLLVFFMLVAFFCITIWVQKRPGKLSPYTGHPLRPGYELPYESAKKILTFLYERLEYDNLIFDLKKASFCRETGRIFPNSITIFDTIYVDWNFLQKRFPGKYVSWGSLNDVQQQDILGVHGSLEGYQIEISSPTSSPRRIEPEYAYTKPGPLYVDINRKILLGWQCIPGTDFEVLIVQRPRKITYLSVNDDDKSKR